MSERQSELGERWLLLLFQLPAQPAYLRVKLWRRLQSIGAVAVKNGVHALPSNAETLEDFEWLAREAVAGGGEATIVEARLVDGLRDEELRQLFKDARDEDYRNFVTEASALASSAGSNDRAPEQLHRLRLRLSQIQAIDFFGAGLRATAEQAAGGAASAIEESRNVESHSGHPSEDVAAKTWVTRSGVYVDRMASAWFIRRFIDREARFKFVPVRDYEARPGELRFDMFQAEYTHVGDSCTMEVLVARFRSEDKAARAVAEIVHDIDLKDSKFGRAEADGIRILISGICARTDDDSERIDRGCAAFDDLYAYFSQTPA